MSAFTNRFSAKTFDYCYKTPLASIIIVICTFAILFIAGYYIKVDEYKELKVNQVIIENGDIKLRFKADKEFIDKIQYESKAYVFTANDSTRNVIYLTSIKNTSEDEYEVKFNNVKAKLLNGHEKDIIIEFSVGKIRAIAKIFNI